MKGQITERDIKYFLDSIAVDEATGCYLWTGPVNPVTGYGQATAGGQPITAHRLAWELNNGEPPEGMCVLHSCDNKLCVFDGHLRLGTKQDNSNDAKARDRYCHNPAPKRKVTPAEISEFVDRYELGHSYCRIAREMVYPKRDQQLVKRHIDKFYNDMFEPQLSDFAARVEAEEVAA